MPDLKRVLIITYYWPPSGGIGVLRCLKLSKYLRQFGWEPVIFTADNAHYPTIDHSNDRDILPDLTVLRGRIWEPYHFYKLLTGQKRDANVNNVFYVQDKKPGLMHRLSVWVRSNFFIPDARALWIKPSVRFLLEYVQEYPVDAIISTGPPHSSNRIGSLLRKATGIPWLADFQDPWTQVDYYQLLHLTAWGDRKHRRLEQDVFRTADRSVIVSPSWKRDLEHIGAHKVSVIPLGFDPDDYRDLARPDGRKFTLTHLGIMGYDRNAPVLFRALKELCDSEPGFRDDLEIQLVGQVDRSVTEALQAAGLEDCVQLPGNVSREEALHFTASSMVLLLLLNRQDNAQGRIPGKLFEYLAVRRPFMLLGPPDADAARIATETGAGQAFEYDNLEGIRGAVAQYYRQYQAGTLARPLDTDIEPYSVIKLTGRFAEILDELHAARQAE